MNIVEVKAAVVAQREMERRYKLSTRPLEL